VAGLELRENHEYFVTSGITSINRSDISQVQISVGNECKGSDNELRLR